VVVVALAPLACSSGPAAAPPPSGGLDGNADGGGDDAAPSGDAAPAVEVQIDSTHASPVSPGYSGFNYSVEQIPNQAQLASQAAMLQPGWVRYPAGDGSQAFDWSTGLSPAAWVDEWQFDPKHYAALQKIAQMLATTGGDPVGPFASFATGAGALGLVVSVNGFTDTAQSAGALASFASAHALPVLAWELANEAYLYPTLFATGADYATRMKPYADAIFAVDPAAVVSLYVDRRSTAWAASMASAGPRYWNAVSMHDYPTISGTTIDERMAQLNDYVVRRLASYIDGTLAPLKLPVIISEFDPGLSADDPFHGCVYDGVYVAEYILRASTHPAVRFVGMHALTGTAGVYRGVVSAQILAAGVANLALRNATVADATKVVGGPSVPAGTSGTVPALFAQAYEANDHERHLVVTNKGAQAATVTVSVDGTPVGRTFSISQVTATDPSTVNTAQAPSTVAVQTSLQSGTLSVPPYAVVHAAWAP
jgi:hypothetical protein